MEGYERKNRRDKVNTLNSYKAGGLKIKNMLKNWYSYYMIGLLIHKSKHYYALVWDIKEYKQREWPIPVAARPKA
jgi:hypothetical protein